MLQRKSWSVHIPPTGDGMPHGWEEARPSNAAAKTDQYSSGNSSVVTLRSHSVMIQSFRSGVIR